MLYHKKSQEWQGWQPWQNQKFYDQTKLIGDIPVKTPIEVMSAFQSLQNQYENICIPHKKVKGWQLSEKQKLENQKLRRVKDSI